MNLILSDRPLPPLSLRAEDIAFDLSALSIHPCVGCFSCWVKTPGRCIIRDDASQVCHAIARCRRILCVTHMAYGNYDVVLRRMLERALPIQQAFICIHRGETHHVQRNVMEKDAVILAYGAQDEQEQAVFRRLVARNAANLNFKSHREIFAAEPQVDSLIQQEVAAWANS